MRLQFPPSWSYPITTGPLRAAVVPLSLTSPPSLGVELQRAPQPLETFFFKTAFRLCAAGYLCLVGQGVVKPSPPLWTSDRKSREVGHTPLHPMCHLDVPPPPPPGAGEPTGKLKRSSLNQSQGPLLELLTHICGRLPPGIPLTPPPCSTHSEQVNLQYCIFSTILAFLK